VSAQYWKRSSNDRHRDPRSAGDGFRDASEERSVDSRPAVATHNDLIDSVVLGVFEDCSRRFPDFRDRFEIEIVLRGEIRRCRVNCGRAFLGVIVPVCGNWQATGLHVDNRIDRVDNVNGRDDCVGEDDTPLCDDPFGTFSRRLPVSE